MLALTETQWFLLILAAAVWTASSVRIALYARKTGRNAVLWFVVTFLLTAIPALIVFNLAYFVARRRDPLDKGERVGRDEARPAGPARCPHCRAIIAPAELPQGPTAKPCPRCGMDIDEAHTA